MNQFLKVSAGCVEIEHQNKPNLAVDELQPVHLHNEAPDLHAEGRVCKQGKRKGMEDSMYERKQPEWHPEPLTTDLA
jgi:hypothetical protein